MWQLSSMRLRIYSLFQKYRARSATWGREMAEGVPGRGFPACARAGIHPKTQGALLSPPILRTHLSHWRKQCDKEERNWIWSPTLRVESQLHCTLAT